MRSNDGIIHLHFEPAGQRTEKLNLLLNAEESSPQEVAVVLETIVQPYQLENT
jgi:hypothetical protein